jgi:hypothetical protein
LNFFSILVLYRFPSAGKHLGGGLGLPLVSNAFQAFVHEFQPVVILGIMEIDNFSRPHGSSMCHPASS